MTLNTDKFDSNLKGNEIWQACSRTRIKYTIYNSTEVFKKLFLE
jgi:hypothetical protein